MSKQNLKYFVFLIFLSNFIIIEPKKYKKNKIKYLFALNRIRSKREIQKKIIYLNSLKNKRSVSLASGSNALQVSTNKFTVDDITGNTNIAGTLSVTGVTTLNGSLNMGAASITNVNLVDSVKVSAHAARHLPGGADALTTGTPVTIGTTNQAGSASSFSLSDHIHAHGNQAGGALHSNATQSTAGFMSSTDKTKLDTLALSNLTDCDTTTTPPVTNNYLKWNGTDWVPGTIVNTNYSAESVTSATTASTSDVLMTSMSITPAVTGTYLVIFEGATRNSAVGNINTFSIYVNSSQIVNSVRSYTLPSASRDISVITTAIVTYITGNIEVRWKVNSGTGTILGRSLRAIKLI